MYQESQPDLSSFVNTKSIEEMSHDEKIEEVRELLGKLNIGFKENQITDPDSREKLIEKLRKRLLKISVDVKGVNQLNDMHGRAIKLLQSLES